jgi:hypothetical protein
MSTDRENYALGDTVRVTARLFDAVYRPLVAPSVKVRVGAEGEADGSDIELMAVPGRDGVYAGSFTARRLGACAIRVTTEQIGGAPVERPSCLFLAELPNVEFVEPQLNPGLLQALTGSSGGSCLTLDQARDLPGRIPDRNETIVTRGKPIELWDTGRILVLLVILLGIEWFLRKRYHLV